MYVGYICEEHNNPADFFLDVLTEAEKSGTAAITGRFSVLHELE